MDKDLLKHVLYGLLRTLLAGVSGWMIQQGLATQGQIETLLLGLAGVIVVAAGSILNKIRNRKKVEAALLLPPTATIEDVHAQLKNQ